MNILGKAIGVSIIAAAIYGGMEYYSFAADNKTHVITVNFSTGTRVNNPDALREAHLLLLDNPDYKFHVTAHTGTVGNPAANSRLSYERARYVVSELSGNKEIPVNARILQLRQDEYIHPARGDIEWVGDTNPLPKNENEGERAYQSRLSRADITIYYGVME